jgi:rubredoxin
LSSQRADGSVTRVDDATRECPLCGGTMRFKEHQAVTLVPGNPKPAISVTREWVCPDCDYFEDAEAEE